MTRFIKDIKKYWEYILYATKSSLKSEVASSHLNWLWWILEPIMFMFIYGFIVLTVFNSREESFSVFVLVGLTVWTFFNNAIKGSVKIVSSNKSIITKVYVPKFVLVLIKLFTLLFKFMISIAIILIIMAITHVPYTLRLINFIPVLLCLFILVFGLCTIITHFGVFVDDLSNIFNVLLRMMFYLSGVFFSITTRVPAPFDYILGYVNPVAYLITEFRNIFIYNLAPNMFLLSFWFIIGVLLSAIGVSLIYKYENSYAKVI